MEKISNNWINSLLLTLLSLWILLPGIAKLPVIDRDEAHFAQASRQMLQSGNFFQIRFQDTTRFRKPPGINWLQAACVKLLSNADASTVWPYRLPSFLGGLFSILLTYFFARRLVGQTSAVVAAVLLASTLLLVVESHMAVIDASLLSSIVLMQGALWIIYQAGMHNKSVHWGWAACFWLAMTYGFLLKGITPLVSILSLICLCISEKQVGWLRGLHLIKGLLLFILVTFAWLILVNTAENTNYLLQIIHHDLLPKLKGSHESHGKPPLFHLVLLPLTFWPASLFLWQAGAYAVKHRSEQVIKFLLAWIIPTWIFFELMPTKLPQYVLPTFPAIAILCALAMNKEQNYPDKWLRFLQVLWLILSLAFAVCLVIVPYMILQQFSLISGLIFMAITFLSITAVYFAGKGSYPQTLFTLALLAVVSYSLIFTQLLPQLTPLWLSNTIVQSINRQTISPDKPLVAVGFAEPSLVFNLNTHLVQFMTSWNAEKILQTDVSRIALVEKKIVESWDAATQAHLMILAQMQGYNYSKGHWLNLQLIQNSGGQVQTQ